MYLDHYLEAITCVKKSHYRKLNITSFSGKERHFKEIFELLLVSLSKDKDTFLKDLKFILNEKYNENLYSHKNEAIQIQDYVRRHFERLYNYLKGQGFKVLAPGFDYYVDHDETISYRFDVIVEYADKTVEGLIFDSKKPKYSYQGRKFETKVINSIELSGLIRKLMSRYPDREVRATFLHLRNKDDKKDLFPNFEYKKGTNVISLSRSDIMKAFKLEESGVIEHIDSVTETFLNLSREKDCKSCSYQRLCKFEEARNSFKPVNIRLSEVSKQSHGSNSPVKLNDEQAMVIENLNGKCQVVAVPGAGKTRILVESIRKNISEKVDPKSILALTFTNKATGELKERLMGIDGAEDVKITNYNTFGYSIVRSHYKEMGFDYPPRLVTTHESFMIIKEALEMFRVKFKYEKLFDKTYGQMWDIYGAVEYAITLGMARNTTMLELEKRAFKNYVLTDEILNFIPLLALRYQAVLKQKNLISYSQQIDLVNELFDANPFIAESLRKKYRYVYLDEYQDTNPQQHKMIMKFAVNNVLMVGDEDQSIFSFIGAEPMNFLSYMKDGSNKFYLSINYRSGSEIIERANILISRNVMRNPKVIRSGTEKKGRVKDHLIECAENVVEIVNELVELNYKPEDIAIIARKNKHLETFKTLLNGAGYKSQSNYNRLLAEEDFILFTSFLKVLSLKAIREDEYIIMKHLYGESSFSMAGSIVTSLMIHGSESYDRLNEDIRMLRQLESQVAQISFIFELIGFKNSAVRTYILELFDNLHLASLAELLKVIDGMMEIDEDVTVSAVGDGVHLLTAHASKGLEFKAVIVYDLDDFAGDEEERRLLYVALTRAEEELHLVTVDKGNRKKEAA